MIGNSDGDPDGWIAVKVNAEGSIVMPYGPVHPYPDKPEDGPYRWAPFYIAAPAPSCAPGEVEAEVARIMALSDEEVLAEANVGDVAWARGFKQGLQMGRNAALSPQGLDAKEGGE